MSDRKRFQCRSTTRRLLGPDATNRLSRHVTDMDNTLEQPKPSSIFNTSSARDEDREQDSSGDEDGWLDWTKLPYVHLPLGLSRSIIAFEFSMRGGAARPVIPK